MKLKHTMLAAAFAAASLSAQADLQRWALSTQPSPPGHGFPLWYQDLSGTVLDICLPNASDPGEPRRPHVCSDREWRRTF